MKFFELIHFFGSHHGTVVGEIRIRASGKKRIIEAHPNTSQRKSKLKNHSEKLKLSFINHSSALFQGDGGHTTRPTTFSGRKLTFSLLLIKHFSSIEERIKIFQKINDKKSNMSSQQPEKKAVMI